jgi:hypothetical protein
MIQVPIHGMENNADSLVGRRKAFLKAYGYGPEEVADYENLTELIGHVPGLSVHTPERLWQMIADAHIQHGGCSKVRLTLFSTVTPYTTAWVTVPTMSAGLEAQDYEQSGLWFVSKVEPVISSGK